MNTSRTLPALPQGERQRPLQPFSRGGARALCPDLVVVGNGIAGATAAREARRLSPDLRVAVVTEQSAPPVYTPGLARLLRGEVHPEHLVAFPLGTEREQRITVLKCRIERIEARQKTVILDGGPTLSYEKLILATGSRPKGFPPHFPGADLDGVIVLHYLRDYLDLRRRMDSAGAVVVVGDGGRALETALSLSHHGRTVHWLVRGPRLMEHWSDAEAARLVLDQVRREGVRVFLETRLEGVIGKVGTAVGVITSQRQILPAQAVVLCTGTAPDTSLAAHCDLYLQEHNGLVTDEYFRTSVPDVYAAGDVAAVREPGTGALVRRGQWSQAALQGKWAAAHLLGRHDLPSTPFGVPWHQMRVGKLSAVLVGDPSTWTGETASHIVRRKGKYCRLVTSEQSLVGFLAIAPVLPPGVLAVKDLIDARAPASDASEMLLAALFPPGPPALFARRNPFTGSGTGANARPTQDLQTRFEE